EMIGLILPSRRILLRATNHPTFINHGWDGDSFAFVKYRFRLLLTEEIVTDWKALQSTSMNVRLCRFAYDNRRRPCRSSDVGFRRYQPKTPSGNRIGSSIPPTRARAGWRNNDDPVSQPIA